MYSHVQTTPEGAYLRKITAGALIEWDANNYCSAFALEQDGKADEFFVYPLLAVGEPQHDPITHAVQEIDPELVDGAWTQQWQVVALSAEQVIANQTAAALAMQAAIVDGMTALFDTTAQSKRYDNRITCALRAGYVGPFQAEGQAFATWMDTCNSLGYTMLAEVQAGTRPMPSSVAEALALLPEMVWPT